MQSTSDQTVVFPYELYGAADNTDGKAAVLALVKDLLQQVDILIDETYLLVDPADITVRVETFLASPSLPFCLPLASSYLRWIHTHPLGLREMDTGSRLRNPLSRSTLSSEGGPVCRRTS